MLNLIVQSGIDSLVKQTQALQKQMAFAASNALNSTAFDARTSLGDSTRNYFNKPTTFTQRGFFVEKATKATLTAIVGADAKRGKYLRTQIAGGQRGTKPFERRIGTSQLVPGAIKTNASGNVTKAAIVKLTTATTKTGKGSTFIGIPKGGNRPFGLYERQGKGGKEVLIPRFLQARPQYNSRFPIVNIVSKTVNNKYNYYFINALEKAIASAR